MAIAPEQTSDTTLTPEQLQKLDLISDTILYAEAVAFIRRLVREEELDPLPNSQILGLLNVAEGSNYSDMYQFVKHQRDRNWSGSKQGIKTFYTDLEKYLMEMSRRRMREEFQLVTPELPKNAAKAEVDALMTALTHDFILHFAAENGVLLAEAADRRKTK